MSVRIPITHLFNAYDLQVNPIDEDKIRSQDVVNYCEARFRVVLKAMMKRSDKDQKWMYSILYREMVLLIACHSFVNLLLICIVSGVMFLLHRGGSCDRPTSSHPGHCPIDGAGHVPGRDDARQWIPTRTRAHDISGRELEQQWTR